MPQLIIFGNTQYAELAHYYFTNDSVYDVKGFAVDDAYLSESTLLGLPVWSVTEVFNMYSPQDCHFFVAIGYSKMNKVRETLFTRLKNAGYHLATYLSTKCTWLSANPPGENCFILENNTVQPFSTIGDNVTLWSGNHIGHHSIVENHSFVSSHVVISGNVRVGHHSFLGVNACIANGVYVAPHSLLGAGVTITSDTTENSVYVSTKAKKLNKTSDYFL